MFNITKQELKIFKIDETLPQGVTCGTAMTRKRLSRLRPEDHLNPRSGFLFYIRCRERACLQKWKFIPAGEPGSQRGGSHAS